MFNVKITINQVKMLQRLQRGTHHVRNQLIKNTI